MEIDEGEGEMGLQNGHTFSMIFEHRLQFENIKTWPRSAH